jgi:outer membrane receptor for ferrienterochelin and colicins
VAILLLGAEPESNGSLEGTITDHSGPVIGVNVGIADLGIGSSTNEEGYFRIQNIPAGEHEFTFSAVGYKTVKESIKISSGELRTISIQLEETTLEMDQVVVTGTMREVYVKDSPVKVNVISQKLLQKSSESNLMDAVCYINGLYNQVGCGVCETNSVRINGMDGPYTAILIDGMPIMGSLASVYGLNGLNPSIIESVEIMKGPNSTLYGSEAMGGVINVRTKDPADAPLVQVDFYGSSHLEQNADVAFAPKTDHFQTLLSANVLHLDEFIDHNNDNFADVTQKTRFSVFNKWSFDRQKNKVFNLAGKYYYEERIGGTSSFSSELKGSDEVYGEYIKTNRAELFSTYEFATDPLLKLDMSYSYHDQESYYGDYNYDAQQQIAFGNLIYSKKLGKKHNLLLGASARHETLDQTFNNIKVDNGSEVRRFIPGVFSQYEYKPTHWFHGLAGMRVDHYEDHGLIASPRLNLKFDVTDHTTLRLNGGTGFRIVNLFTEEHEALTGSREVVLSEDLNPERSINGTVNLNQIVDIGPTVLNMDFDLFYTHFSNQILPDYSFENEIRYSNLDGHSVSRGVAISAAHNFPGPFQYSVGVTLQDVFSKENGTKEQINFAPPVNGVFSLSYVFTSMGLAVDYTGRVVGRMHLPEYPGRSSKSNLFTEQNIKLTQTLSGSTQLYMSVKNLFNYTQSNPLISPDRPFSDDFATDYVYGPMQSRRVLVGLRFTYR